jgi:hypothetical protein
VVAAARGLRGDDVDLRIHRGPADRVPGGAGKLGQERALGAPVALPERVQGVDVAEQIGQCGHERRPVQVAQVVVAAGELAEDVLGEADEVLRRQNRSVLAIEAVRSSPAQPYRSPKMKRKACRWAGS